MTVQELEIRFDVLVSAFCKRYNVPVHDCDVLINDVLNLREEFVSERREVKI